MRVVSSVAALTLAIPQLALAQLDLAWHTIDSGGGTASAGTLSLFGVIGQPDAGTLTAGAIECRGGFIPGGGPAPCYANCDQSTIAPVLTANDFQCFLNAFAAASLGANCDGSTTSPTLTANDFQCFLNAYAAGCP